MCIRICLVILLLFPLMFVESGSPLDSNATRCYFGTSGFDSMASNTTRGKDIACCASFSLDPNNPTREINYTAVSQTGSDYDKELRVEDPDKGVCFIHDSKFFVCCCLTNNCNTNSFVKYYFYKYTYTHDNSTRDVLLYYIPLIVFVSVAILTAIGAHMGLNYFIIQPYQGEYVSELPPIYYANLRGVNVLPYMTKGETKMVIRQIKTARATEPPEVKTITKKPQIVGVFTYSTTATVTNRELGSVVIKQPENDPFMSTLIRMIEIGPREVKYDGNHLLEIIEKAEEIFLSEPTLLEVPVPVQVYGDIHGQYSDLLRWLHINGWPPTTRSCFLGDYVDRGRHSIEVIVMLFLLKIVMPNDVFLCRGNHEDYNINKVYSFYAELEARVDNKNKLHEKVFKKFMHCFSCIPLAARIGNRVLGMHGGISPKLESWDDIRNIKRPTNLSPGSLACDLAWSDPERGCADFELNYKRDRKSGIGYVFGQQQVLDVCKMMDIDLVIRGHQAPMGGYELFANNSLITIFSAPGYRSTNDFDTNFGASLYIAENGSMIVTRVGVDNHVRLLRELQKLDKGEPYTNMDKLKLKHTVEDEDGSY